MKSKRQKPRASQDTEMIEKLANRIKQLRKDRGYSSYEDFANDNDIHRAQYGRYEKGQNMRYTSLVKLAKTFNVSLSEFFGEGFE